MYTFCICTVAVLSTIKKLSDNNLMSGFLIIGSKDTFPYRPDLCFNTKSEELTDFIIMLYLRKYTSYFLFN